MFVYTVRASAIKVFGVLVLMLVLIAALAVGSAGTSYVSAAAGGQIKLTDMKSAEDRRAFLASFGINVVGEEEVSEFVMPENFDLVIAGYNEIQKAQGLDLTKYARKRITRYTYRVESDAEGAEVYATLLIYRDRLVGCDLSSADPEGFVKPIITSLAY